MRKYPTLLLLSALLSVAACNSNHDQPSDNVSDTPVFGKAINDVTGMHDEKEARLATSANNAIAEGKTKEALLFYSKLYKDHPEQQDTALNYAQLLRKTGKAKEAVKVLSPFINGRSGEIRGNARPIMLNEYAAANIDLGKYQLAEDALNKVLEDQKATRFYPDADNLLGLVLDAKNQHKEAEQYYRQALAGWKGDPVAVMNNLGLCLAAQGEFDESLTVLRQALIKAPNNEEVAANIQMVTALRHDVLPTAPIAMAPTRH